MMEDSLDVTVDNSYDSEEQEDDDDDFKHAKLLDAISSLDGKKKSSASQRTVLANQISEFNFSSTKDQGKVKLHELVGTLRDTTSHGTLKKQLRAVQKRAKVVATPLPRLEQERIQRGLAYETTSKEISKWDPVVDKNRKAEQLKFPLQQPDLKVVTRTDEFVKRFQARTPLEKEVAALLHGSDSVLENTQVLTAAEQRALDAMSLEEAKMRRAELQKYRALLSYKEAKARWQKKIKSKSYHKHLRKSKQKEELKAIEELQKNDPMAYVEKMKQLEKDRIEERMNLKHRGGSKFLQRQKMYSKYQDQARQAVQDMYQKSRELTQKTAVESDSDESVASMKSADELHLVEDTKGSNPWMSVNTGKKIRIKTWDDSVEDLVEDKTVKDLHEDSHGRLMETPKSDVEKAEEDGESRAESLKEEEHNLERKQKSNSSRKKNQNVSQKDDTDGKSDNASSGMKETVLKKGNNSIDSKLDIDELFEQLDKNAEKSVKRAKKKKLKKREKPLLESQPGKDGNEEEETVIQESLQKKSKFEDFDVADEDDDEETHPVKKTTPVQKEERPKAKKHTAEIYVDPKKLFTLETKVQFASLPDIVVNDDEDIAEDEQRMTIAEAFADDDVIEEFAREKERSGQRQKAKDIDLTLPGWGQWGGTGVQVNKKRRKRFLIKAPQGPPRKDRKLGNVIISEQKDEAIAKHQVSHLPFPYTNVQQFERSIRAPVGKTWNPETAFKKMTKPKVVTRLGTVIKPMDKSEMFRIIKESRHNIFK
ncbi:LOW QUALITY PROTEIN: U3 small nucleolar RNA-associated protein 14 homolog A-like [Liolophura sinensis]|uniref:LOW QUALITY PROTEIN: U3 small nucleolar RNA-associated protein 14 homolog A-like n=1 Tax=Liolophura sinensis TaxID=3198878 RepID=UPI003157F5CB